MKELCQIRDAVICALRGAGLEAGAAFPDQRVQKHPDTFAVAAVGGAEGKAVGFCNYLGECIGPDGNLQELYGKLLEGEISIDVRGNTAGDCDRGCETASDILLGGLPEGIRPGALKWDPLCWDKNLQMFLRHGSLSCSALFVASQREDEGGFCDFILKGALFS